MTKNGRPYCVAPASNTLRDVRVIHHRQRLPLLLEARDHLLRVHAQLDDLQRHAPPHRLLLLRHPDGAEAALADLLQQLVGPDAFARLLRLEPRELLRDLGRDLRLIQKIGHVGVRLQQHPHPPEERLIATALGREKFRPRGLRERHRTIENRFRPRFRNRLCRRGFARRRRTRWATRGLRGWRCHAHLTP